MIDLSGLILVAGAGVSGAGCAKMLTELGAKVAVIDDNETARLRVAEATGAQHASTADAPALFAEAHMVVTSPGWRPDTPLLLQAAAAGLEVVGDVELAWRLDQAGAYGQPRTWLGITGTNGKTTTTAMAAAMIDGAEAVGNIGVAVGEALTATKRVETLVVELSSFQLHWSQQMRLQAGVLLNLADDHIDWHGSFDEYAAAKAKILRGDVAIIGADDPEVVARAPQGAIGFTLDAPKDGQLGVENGYLVDRAFGGGVLAPATGISPAGPAGVLDALAAAALARSQGVAPERIASALQTYEVSGHRGQVVHTDPENGVAYIDNSKATNPHAADAALQGHDSVVWVAGGQLKGADVDQLLRTHAHRLKEAVLLGVDKQLLADALQRISPATTITLIDSTDPEEAMQQAVAAARATASAGDVVLLAPAAASLDMYTGMGQRGELFAKFAKG